MSARDLLTDVGTLSAVASLLAAGVRGLRWYLRYLTERHRWDTVKALVDQHGPDVLDRLPELAYELRDRDEPGASPAVRRTDRPEQPLPRRNRPDT